MTPPGYREGPPRTFVPVCVRRPWGWHAGPIGWVEVEEVTECPIVIDATSGTRPQNRQAMLLK